MPCLLRAQAANDAARANRPLAIASSTPKEGAVLAVDNFVLHRSGPRPDPAYQFINFMLDGENSAQLSNMIGSDSINAAAMAHIDDAVKNNKAVFPDAEGMKRLQMLKDYGRRERRLLNRLWTEIKVRLKPRRARPPGGAHVACDHCAMGGWPKAPIAVPQ